MSLKDRVIRFADLTDNQIGFIVSHLDYVIYSIRMTYEVIPAFKTSSEKFSDGDVLEYESGKDFTDYIEENEEYLPTHRKLQPDDFEWNKRLIARIFGHDPETGTSKYDDRDLQSMWPIGADVWSDRMSYIYDPLIAPLALLLPDTWKLYGMEVSMTEKNHDYPYSVSGKGRSVIEEVWKAIGGKIQTLYVDSDAASNVTLDHWTLPNQEEWLSVVKEFLAFAKEKLGIAKYNELRKVAHHENDDEEEEDEDEMDEEPE